MRSVASAARRTLFKWSGSTSIAAVTGALTLWRIGQAMSESRTVHLRVKHGTRTQLRMSLASSHPQRVHIKAVRSEHVHGALTLPSPQQDVFGLRLGSCCLVC